VSAAALQGFANQTRREAGTWWSTSRWWVHMVIWTSIVNGLLAAKFVAHALAILAVLVLVPWLGVLAQLSLAHGGLWPLGRWLGAVALVGMLAVFHLALVLALSALTWSRALIVALPLVGIIGTDLLVAFLPGTFDVLPWSLGPLAGPVLAGGILIGPGPILATAVLTLVCLAAAAVGLRRKEL
jgi:hypothetical protein